MNVRTIMTSTMMVAISRVSANIFLICLKGPMRKQVLKPEKRDSLAGLCEVRVERNQQLAHLAIEMTFPRV